MKGHGSQYERRSGLLLVALLDSQNKTVEEAAQKAGISPATAFRWQQRPDFRERLRSARQEQITQGFAKAIPLLPEMIQQAYDIAKDTVMPGTARVSAIRVIGEYAKIANDRDLNERLNELNLQVRQIQGESVEQDFAPYDDEDASEDDVQ